MPDGSGEVQPAKDARNVEGGPKRVWELATRNQAQSGRAPRSSPPGRDHGRSSRSLRRTRRTSVRSERNGGQAVVQSTAVHGPAPAWGTMAAGQGRSPRGPTALRRRKASHRTGRCGPRPLASGPEGSPPSGEELDGLQPVRRPGSRSRKPREHTVTGLGPRSGRPHEGPPTRRSRQAVRPRMAARRFTGPSSTTTDSSAVGQWTARRADRATGRGWATSGWQARRRRCTGRTPAHGSGSGK